MNTHRTWLMGAVLAFVTAALFSPTVNYEFVRFDDPRMVTQHEYVSQGLTLESLQWSTYGVTKSNWHPLTVISHMIDVELYGLEAGGHHATNVFLHSANVALLFLFLQAATGSFWRSALVAALFGLHPLRVESVAWISQRKDVLSTSFGLLSLIAFVRYARSGRSSWRKASLALFAAGLFAKPMLVTFPFVFLLIDYWPLRRLADGDDGQPRNRRIGSLLKEKIAFFVLGATVAIVTVIAQNLGAATRVGDILPFSQRFANAAVSYVAYMGNAVWPSQLAIHYPHRYVAKAGGVPPEAWQVAAASALLVAITLGAVAMRRRRYLLMGWLWYVGMLVPVIGLLPVGLQSMADRYTYLPLTGLFIAVVWGLGEAVSRGARRAPALRIAAAVAAVALVAGYATVTARLLPTWRNSLTLFEHAARVSPTDTVVRLNLGYELMARGRLRDAIAQFERVLETAPRSFHARQSLDTARKRLDRQLVRDNRPPDP